VTEGFFRLSAGGIGGKGDGLALLASLVDESETGVALRGAVPGLAIAIPRTATIGVDAFAEFTSANMLRGTAAAASDWPSLRETFLASPLPVHLVEALDAFLPEAGRPLICRSSSLLEDARDAPFSGVYESYAIPNSHAHRAMRLRQLCDAVRLVYASLFSPAAIAYREAAGCPEDSEAMAVLIQELVGSARGRWFYPVLSGTAQSFNYYPLSYARPEDGLCVAALGLGSHVVEGGASHRFCPLWPLLDATPPELAGDGAQRTFRALDLELAEPDLTKGESAALAELDIEAAEGNGVLDLVASTWDRDDLRLVPGALRDGPRIIDLAPVLKYEVLPFAKAIAAALAAAERTTGGPVELEFALEAGGRADPPDKTGPTLYLLQLKKLRRARGGSGVDLSASHGTNCLIFSERAMGEGRITGLRDLVWIDPDTFDRSRSREAAEQVAVLDRELGALGKRYILIGPGRWGSRDPWLGIPVDYPQIVHAAAIVETELPGFAVEFSFGSHFLRNVSGRGIGYLAVPSRGASGVDWESLSALPRLRSMGSCSWSQSEEPLEVLMDGLNGRALIRTATE
jgi:hypothetical protein